MFVGSINSKIRNLIFTEKKLFSERNICVGCSGNFTVEQILQGIGCKIWSNDIALYSSLIGNHLAGKPMRLEIADPAYGWLAPYIDPGGVSRMAAVFLLFEMLKQEKGNNLQQIRLHRHYSEHFDEFHRSSCVRISRTLADIRIDDYTTIDAYDLYRDLPEEWIRVAKREVLEKLDPVKVFGDLGQWTILLCWESPGQDCHRRLVAEWLEKSLKIKVPEL